MSDYQYKMVNGELVPLTEEEIAALEELAANPPPMPQPLPDQGVRANQRLDAGVAAAQPSLDEAENITSRRQPRDEAAQIAQLQEQVNALQQALSDMVLAHTGPTPRSN